MARATIPIKLAIGAGLLASSALLASPADDVRIRVAGLRELGAAFKAAMDGLRGGEVQTILVQQAARQIGNAAQAMPHWFPQGSGPQSGIKTAAKPEIWLKPAQFKAAQDAFAAEAVAFQQVAASGGADAIRGEARKPGAACKGCHDTFRVSKQN